MDGDLHGASFSQFDAIEVKSTRIIRIHRFGKSAFPYIFNQLCALNVMLVYYNAS